MNSSIRCDCSGYCNIIFNNSLFNILFLLILALCVYISIGVGVWLSIIYPYVYAQNKISNLQHTYRRLRSKYWNDGERKIEYFTYRSVWFCIILIIILLILYYIALGSLLISVISGIDTPVLVPQKQSPGYMESWFIYIESWFTYIKNYFK